MAALRQFLGESQKVFHLASDSEPIRLRAFAIYPYIGLDFGRGDVALLEPTTMLCTYSD